MFRQAMVKLTITYSVLITGLLWLFSGAVYYALEGSLAGDPTAERLHLVLALLNGGSLLIIPLVGWFLASETLKPIKKAHEQQRRFISDASHELRTPLAILRTDIDVALKKNRSVEYYHSLLQQSRDELIRLSELANSLLVLARSDSSELPLVTQDVDVVDLLAQTVAKFRERLNHKRLECSVVFPEESLLVTGNPQMLEQVFTNLLDNAMKFSSEGGNITVAAVKRGAEVTISFRDQGVGMSLEEQEKIFEPFYQVDAARSRATGSGLGLAISRAVVKRHHGKLTVDSTPGAGSTFVVSLPAPK